MIASQVVVAEKNPPFPVLLGSMSFTIRPAGPTANTVPTMIRRTTEKTRMTAFIVLPRYIPVTSAMETPLCLSESIPDM